jgi:hypothetical protein
MDPAINPSGKVCIGIACARSGISGHVAEGINEAKGLSASSSQIDTILELIKP